MTDDVTDEYLDELERSSWPVDENPHHVVRKMLLALRASRAREAETMRNMQDTNQSYADIANAATARADAAEAEVERLNGSVAFFAERLETQDHQYSAAHPSAARYRALREGLEKRAEAAEAEVASYRDALHRYWFALDLFEQCSKRQETWSGVAQAAFTAIRGLRVALEKLANYTAPDNKTP